MRKVVLSMFISLDGYIEGPGGRLVVPPDSPNLRKYWIEDGLGEAGTLTYGRVIYEGLGAVAKLVGIGGGVVSGCFNPNESSVSTLDRRPRHDEHYHEARCRSA